MDIVSSATKALQLIRLFYQDASGIFFLLSLVRRGWCFFTLWPDTFLLHFMQSTGEALVKQSPLTEDDIHITSTDVDCNNINIHCG